MKWNFTKTIIHVCSQGFSFINIVYLMKLDVTFYWQKTKQINFLRSCTRDELINFLMLSIRSRSHLEVLCFLPFWMNGVGKQQECFKEFIMWNFWMTAPVGTRNSFDRYCTEGGRSCVKVRVHIIQIMNKKLIIKFSSSDFYEWNKLIHFEERMASEPID